MSLLTGLLHAFLVVLAASGSLKLLRPQPTVDAMQAAKLLRPRQRRTAITAARAIGGVELALSVWSLWVGSPLALAAAALLFVAFNLFLDRLTRFDATASCGCLGSASGAPGVAHRLVNWMAVAVLSLASMAAVAGKALPTIVDTFAFGIETTLPYLVTVAVLAWLLAALPALSDLNVQNSKTGVA